MQSHMVRVWDPLVRIGHWLLAVGFVVAYLTEDDFETLHVWAGYLVGAIVVVRVIWGFVGPRHARFADFAYTPRLVFSYLMALLRGGSKRYLGHSPAGGARTTRARWRPGSGLRRLYPSSAPPGPPTTTTTIRMRGGRSAARAATTASTRRPTKCWPI